MIVTSDHECEGYEHLHRGETYEATAHFFCDGETWLSVEKGDITFDVPAVWMKEYDTMDFDSIREITEMDFA